jgi:type IV pilus assembly protein PilW
MAQLVRERGLTMVELLLSMAIGLAVLLACAALLVSANRAYLAQAEGAALDDGGRFALELIGRAVGQASHVDWEQVDPAKGPDSAAPPRLAGLDSKSISKTANGIDNPLPDAVNGSDVLAVRFTGAGPAPDGDGSVNSCAGFPVHAHEEGWSIFYVARNAQGEAELRCKYRGAGNWGADAVVSGVDGFQVLYGVDLDATPDGIANRYVNASALAALDAALVLEGANPAERAQELRTRTYWKRVVSVKVGLLLHGTQAAQDGLPGRYDLFGMAYGEAQGDADRGARLRLADLDGHGAGREHSLYAATFVLRSPAR